MMRIVVLLLILGVANTFAELSDTQKARVSNNSKNNKEMNQQLMTITGVVSDDKGEVIPGVSVVLKGSTIGTITDIDGKYTISDVPQGATLVFSFIGMKSQEIIISGESVINVSLNQETIGLDEVIAVGYGKLSKRNVTGAVQSLETEELDDIPTAQLTQKVQGKLAGVQINQTTGIPGQGMSIRVRGQASINAGNDPLYVVDGFSYYRGYCQY